MNTNHTPLPWMINVSSDGSLDVSPDGGDMICDLKHCAEAESNAQYIVQACNAHPALVEALEAIASMRPPLMTKEQEKAFEYHPSTCDAYRVDMAKVLLNAIMEARAALALASGEKGESK